MMKALFTIALVCLMLMGNIVYAAVAVDGVKESEYLFFGDLTNGSGKTVGKAYLYLDGVNLYIYVEAVENSEIYNTASDETYARLYVDIKQGNGKVTIEFDDFDAKYFDATGKKYWEAREDISQYLNFTQIQIHTNFVAPSITDEPNSTGTYTGTYPNPSEPGIPIDGGLSILAMFGLGYGVYANRKRK